MSAQPMSCPSASATSCTLFRGDIVDDEAARLLERRRFEKGEILAFARDQIEHAVKRLDIFLGDWGNSNLHRINDKTAPNVVRYSNAHLTRTVSGHACPLPMPASPPLM